MNVGVFIGRFQPFHDGHASVLKQIVEQNQMAIVVVGSANRHQSIKNPFDFRLRKRMIELWWEAHIPQNRSSLAVVPAEDNLYKDWSWKASVVQAVENAIPYGADVNISLYGHFKDDSSYYLNMFPEWDLKSVPNFHDIDATGIRETFFESGVVSQYHSVPDTTASVLKEFKGTQKYLDLVEEHEYYERERVKFSDYPYPQTLNFTCSDAVVVCQGHILLVNRKHAPGKGTWALPGGFKEADETFLEGCIRELTEETNLRVPEKVLLGSIKASQMFDSTRRNLGVPRVTMAYHIEIAPNYDGTMPEVRPASDAGDVKWIPFSEVLNQNLFDDHLDIIKFFI